MSEAVQIALIATILPTVTALLAFLVSWRNNKKTDDLVVKSDVIIDKAEEIHVLTNSNLTKVKVDLELANNEIGKLRELVTSLITTDEDKSKVEEANVDPIKIPEVADDFDL